MSDNKLTDQIDTVRDFNRFYTKEIGVITEQLLNTPYTLPEARVLFELAHHHDLTTTKLAVMLRLDRGYLSRLLTSLEKSELLKRIRSKTDARQRMLKLSDKGKKAFSILNSRSKDQVKAMLTSLPEEDRIRLLKAMSMIKEILNPRAEKSSPVLLRTHRSGDIGWILQRHGILYNEEYRFDETFEALVAEILSKTIMTYNHKKDHIWIAEIDGERAGTILVTEAEKSIAQLRLFLVEPWARGQGIGKILIEECIRFAKQAGFKKMKLWTQSILHAAGHLYERSGFELTAEEPHRSFGHDLIAQIWELEL
jgi:DNA-binding MarR family transcriptional regulator/GNAT superfamily N-acetyltransferase